jgi:Zn-dependent peptidase ImmA (M78 family)
VIDLWPHKLRGLRGAYFNDELGPTVMLAKDLPSDPLIFTMAHELKHHLVDRHLSISFCDRTNESEQIEIGAEIFAAELIYPEDDFVKDYKQLNVKGCTPEILVRLKQSNQTTLSYAGLAKRAEFLGFAPAGSLQKYRGWKKLEEQLFGVPLYKRLLLKSRGYV